MSTIELEPGDFFPAGLFTPEAGVDPETLVDEDPDFKSTYDYDFSAETFARASVINEDFGGGSTFPAGWTQHNSVWSAATDLAQTDSISSGTVGLVTYDTGARTGVITCDVDTGDDLVGIVLAATDEDNWIAVRQENAGSDVFLVVCTAGTAVEHDALGSTFTGVWTIRMFKDRVRFLLDDVLVTELNSTDHAHAFGLEDSHEKGLLGNSAGLSARWESFSVDSATVTTISTTTWLEQSLEKLLLTKRYTWLVYDHLYGTDAYALAAALIADGTPTDEEIEDAVVTNITAMLLNDSRISSIDTLTATYDDMAATCEIDLTAVDTFGDTATVNVTLDLS